MSKGQIGIFSDLSSKAAIGIDYAHYEIHAGSTFHVSYADIALADDGTIEFVFTVNTPKEAHLIFHAACGGDATVELFEAPTTVTGGTALTERQKYRPAGDGGNQVTVVRDPASIGGDGDMLDTKIVPGGTGGNATGGAGGQRDEWPLKAGETYLLRLTNIAGAAKPASLSAEWYEHTPAE